MWQWTINNFEAGLPLLAAIALRLPAVPAGLLRQLLRKGRISCEGVVAGDNLPVAAGMTVALRSSARLDELMAGSGVTPERLLFEDAHTLVVAKPAGLAIHRAAGIEEHLQGQVARFLAWRQAPYRARPVHRLDIGTSGPVLFAKGRQAAGDYGRLLMAGRFRKQYLALVTGTPPETGELTTPVPDGGRYREALTRYRCLASSGRYALLDLELVTGRTHQARRQLADAGWPIVNDRRYGGAATGTGHIWLHCRQLTFPAVDGDVLHQIDAPAPLVLAELLQQLGFVYNPNQGQRNLIFMTPGAQERL
jgi:23S rRNA-/tRNA-specific pseudouridylate synthase